MSENKIYDLAMKMTNKNVIMQDLNEATNIVQNMFKEKYINKMQSEVVKQLKKTSENPSKELQLLMSIKNFMNPNQQAQIDKFIETVTLLESFGLLANKGNQESMNQNMSNNAPYPYPYPYPGHGGNNVRMAGAEAAMYETSEAAWSADPSIHSDGIYDVDQVCLAAKNTKVSAAPFKNLIMLMLLGKGGAF